MSGGTRSYEMAKRMVAAGHEVHMVTSHREEEKDNNGWFTTDESGIKVHWYPVPYSNHMSYAQRILAFFSFLTAGKAVTEASSTLITPLSCIAVNCAITIPPGTLSKRL